MPVISSLSPFSELNVNSVEPVFSLLSNSLKLFFANTLTLIFFYTLTKRQTNVTIYTHACFFCLISLLKNNSMHFLWNL